MFFAVFSATDFPISFFPSALAIISEDNKLECKKSPLPFEFAEAIKLRPKTGTPL